MTGVGMTSSRHRRFDLIAFDWDGTLFDSTQIIVRCIQAAVSDVGGAVPSDGAAAFVVGMALAPALAPGAMDPLAQRAAVGAADGVCGGLFVIRNGLAQLHFPVAVGFDGFVEVKRLGRHLRGGSGQRLLVVMVSGWPV